MSAKKSSSKSSNKGTGNAKSGKPASSNVSKEALEDITTRLHAASQLIIEKLDQMEDGEKVTLKTLAEMVTDQLDIPPANLNPIINLVVDKYPGLSRAKGRNGGIYKGEAPLTARQLDQRPRCPHCKQVMRAKKKKAEDTESAAA